MRIAIERRRPVEAVSELTLIITPRANGATIAAAERLFAAATGAEPYSLDLAATGQERWFLLRAGTAIARRHLESHLAAAYPQAELRHLDVASVPSLDPALPGPDEQVLTCSLLLHQPPYLPLRTFRDGEADAARNPQADPVLGILESLAAVPDGWRALAQLVVSFVPADWCRDYHRLAVEPTRSAASEGAGSLAGVLFLAGLLAVGAVGLQGYLWYLARDWLHLALLAVGVPVVAFGIWRLAGQLGQRATPDPRLVRDKLGHAARRVELRLSVFAPRDTPLAELAAQLAHVAGAYGQFAIAAGNAFVPHPLSSSAIGLRGVEPLTARSAIPILNTRELAGLWHLPQASDDTPLLERTTARRLLPLAATVARGCPIGTSVQLEHRVAVALPDTLLHRNLLLVAKTRRGKSSLMLRLARYLMDSEGPGEPPGTLVLIDPHRDLARAALGCVPPHRQRDVVFLNAAEAGRPFGLNLLDVGLGWARDKAIDNALAIFRREFERFWGLRMEDAFRFPLLTLCEANEAICAESPTGRDAQHTILEIPTLLADVVFRREVLPLVKDPVIKAWWSGYFDKLDRRLQNEIINPVQTKVQRFAGSLAARAVVGQPRSTIDPTDWLRRGAIVLVDTARGELGEDTAALIGGTLINLVGLVVAEQAKVPPGQRRPVTVLVDEFHTIAGANYEVFLSELAKFGASLVLATQSLTRLDAIDRAQSRVLRSTVFANLDGLFAFQTSAEDAHYLVREFAGEIDETDLVVLGDHQCYAKISVDGERLPTFSVQLDPPPASDPALTVRLAGDSALRYGRDRALVEQDLQAAIDRIAQSHRALLDQTAPGQPNAGVGDISAAPAMNIGSAKRRVPPRSDHRPPRTTWDHQPELFPNRTEGDGAPLTPDVAESVDAEGESERDEA